MLKKFFRKFTLQRKIVYTVLSLSILTVFMIVILITYKNYKQIYDNKINLSLQTSKALSFMEQPRKSLKYESDNEHLHSLITNIKEQVDASFIYVVDDEGFVISHTNNQFREYSKGVNTEYQAIVFGGSYTLADEVFGDNSVLGISPVFLNDDQVIGAVVVGYLVEGIYIELFNQVVTVLKISLIPLTLGIVVSFLLAKNIRRDTYGMEPSEIALLYQDRNTILSSMSEGLIAIDNDGKVTLMNRVAREIFGTADRYIGENIKSLFEAVNEDIFFLQDNEMFRYETLINNTPVIVRVVSLKNKNGFVITIIDKSELKEVRDALKEVKRYSDDLRAQTHEFSNKLYVILGLIQLNEYEKVEEMIMEEVTLNEYSNRVIFEQISDPNVQAILLGKISKATENKVKLIIDENSNLDVLPSHIKTSQLTIIIGNLIDNAIEAVKASEHKTITFFGLDYGNDIIFEVSDQGTGIDEGSIERIFDQGYSTKEYGIRGFGLINVQKALKEVDGSIEISSTEEETTFTTYIPKRLYGGNDND